ncbi:MAG: DUF1016 family protein [Paludibacteraceae bacterium]|nr:DUF1016 family protein [Paludibacteraceae bacterium]
MGDLAKTDNCINDIKTIIEQGRQAAYSSVNLVMINTYWNIGRRIVEEEQNGDARAEYGKQLIDKIAVELTIEYGNNYEARRLRDYRQFYLLFRDLQIWHARVPNLKWTHFRTLLRVADEDARIWYMKEANEQMWSTRTLDRNISTQYYYRLLQSPKKEAVIAEMKEKTVDFQQNKFELLKSPIVAEFLGYKAEDAYTEKELETSILSHIRDFLMEMGKGFAFVARQQHIVTDTEDYYIDLVFYNIELRCYVLIDLKMGKVTHQDVGQMDMYVRMYDELKRKADEDPTIGILLCAETSADIARYSVLNDNKQLYMAKYLTYLPTEDQLRTEIERQKEIFYLQHPELKPTSHEQDRKND